MIGPSEYRVRVIGATGGGPPRGGPSISIVTLIVFQNAASSSTPKSVLTFSLQSAVLQRTAAQCDRWRAEITIDGVPDQVYL